MKAKIPKGDKLGLLSSWEIYFDCGQGHGCNTSDSWNSYIKNLGTVRTIEDFWTLWNNIFCDANVINFPSTINLRFFKTGIEPSYDDPKNENGGRWVTSYMSDHYKALDIFMVVLLECLGKEKMESEICGVVLQKKGEKKWRIQIWVEHEIQYPERFDQKYDYHLNEIVEMDENEKKRYFPARDYIPNKVYGKGNYTPTTSNGQSLSKFVPKIKSRGRGRGKGRRGGRGKKRVEITK